MLSWSSTLAAILGRGGEIGNALANVLLASRTDFVFQCVPFRFFFLLVLA